MYSSLFSSVTRMLSPPSFSSWVVTLPRISMSWMKNSSRPHSSRLFSLEHGRPRGRCPPQQGLPVLLPHLSLLVPIGHQGLTGGLES